MSPNAKSISKLMRGLALAIAGGLFATGGARAAIDKPEAACLCTQAEVAKMLGSGAGAPYEVKMGSRSSAGPADTSAGPAARSWK